MQVIITLSMERLENQIVTTKHAPEIIVTDDFHDAAINTL